MSPAIGLLALLLGAAQSAPAQIADATKFNVTFEGKRVTGCTVTATSGYAQVDRYVCDAARICSDQYSWEKERAKCIAKKREELATALAKNPDRAK